MKKVLIIFSLICLIFSIIGCGETCYDQNGTLPSIDYSHIHPQGSFNSENALADSLKPQIKIVNDTLTYTVSKNGKTYTMYYKISPSKDSVVLKETEHYE